MILGKGSRLEKVNASGQLLLSKKYAGQKVNIEESDDGLITVSLIPKKVERKLRRK